MVKEFQSGDKVQWHTAQGKTDGEVVEKITAPTSVKGHLAKASTSHPEYKVKSAKSGAYAIHTPEALEKK